MFFFLPALLLYALVSYGAVLPYSWLLLSGLWSLGFAVLLLVRSLQGKSISLPLLVLWLGCSGLAAFGNAKFALGAFSAVWAWTAAKRGAPAVLKFFNFLICIGIVEALLALIQTFLSPGDIFGYRIGTLINRNHFAGIMEMLIPVALGVAFVEFRRARNEPAKAYVFVLAGAFMGLALVFSLSRSGIFSFLVTVVLVALLLRESSGMRQTTALVLCFGGLILAGALWLGIDVVLERYNLLLQEEALLREGRTLVFRDTLRMIRDMPLGVGFGNYADKFRQYQTAHPEVLFDHAHNDYLEMAAEWGVLPAAAFWAAVAWVFWRGMKIVRLRHIASEPRGILLACTAATFALSLHSLTDFNLQIPSNGMLFFTLIGISLGTPIEPAPSKLRFEQSR
jgi:O-antigen ligase